MGLKENYPGCLHHQRMQKRKKDYTVNNSIKIFRATVFGVRNDTMPKASPGWNISELKGNDNLDWFIELVEKPVDVLDNF